MRLLLAALLALGSVPAQAGGVLSGRVASAPGGFSAAGALRAARVGVPVLPLSASLSAGLAPALAPALPVLPALQGGPALPLAPALSRGPALPAASPASARAAAAPAPAPAAASQAPRAKDQLDSSAGSAAGPPARGEDAPESAKASGDARFDGSPGARRVEEEGGAVSGAWSRRRARLGALGLTAFGAALFSRSGPTQAVPAPDVAAGAARELAAAASHGFLQTLGQAGYVAGNALAFVFPAFEIYRAYRTGSSAAMPAGRAALLIGSSLAVGLFVLTLSGLPVWAIQNIFGALALAVVWPSAWAARKLGIAAPGEGFSPKAAVATAATSGLTLGLSAALYHLVAAPFVPALVKTVFGAAAIGAIALGLQAAAAAVQLFLFAPDLLRLYRGQPSKGGFSPGFTLALTLASLSFVVYSAVRLAGAPSGSTQMWQFLLYTVLYLLYTATSGAAWWLGRPRKN